MADIRAFKGWYYNQDKVEIDKVITPPHDVISSVGQEKYYKLSEYNFIRVNLGMVSESDDNENNRYIRAAEFLQQWTEDKILLADDKPGLYAYQMNYSLENGKRTSSFGFIALLKLEPFENNIVLPHEETLPRQMADRYNLVKACKADLSPIMVVYSDPALKTNNLLKDALGDPFLSVTDGDSVEHILWKINDENVIGRLQKEFVEKKIYIADGHHRYTTALRHSQDNHENSDGYILVLLQNMDDNVTVLPTHRVVKDVTSADVTRLKECFDFEKLNESDFFEQLESEKNGHVFGMLFDNQYHLLRLKPDCISDAKVEGKSDEWNNLDVTLLNQLIIEDILGIKNDSDREKKIAFTKDISKVLEYVNSGEYSAAFYMRPTDVHQVKSIADKGERMPQKSTYFYPKALSGLIIHRFNLTQ